MATSVGRSVAGRMIGRRGVNQSDGRSIGRLVESVRRSVGPTITHCPQLIIRYPYPRHPLVEPLSNTSFSRSYPRGSLRSSRSITGRLNINTYTYQNKNLKNQKLKRKRKQKRKRGSLREGREAPPRRCPHPFRFCFRFRFNFRFFKI